MDILVLRLIHVLAGAFWFGSAFTMFLFLQPTAEATGPDGQRFMLHLLRNRRLSEVSLAAAVLTGAAGGILFWLNSSGLQASWITQPQGLGFTLGGMAGLGALLLFAFVGFPAGTRIIAIGSRLESERRPPNEDEQRILGRSQAVLKRVGLVVLVLLGIAAAAMSTARYWALVL